MFLRLRLLWNKLKSGLYTLDYKLHLPAELLLQYIGIFDQLRSKKCVNIDQTHNISAVHHMLQFCSAVFKPLLEIYHSTRSLYETTTIDS